MPQYPAGIGTSNISCGGHAPQGKPLAWPGRPAGEPRAMGCGRFILHNRQRVVLCASQWQSPPAPLPAVPNQSSHAPPPRPPPPPLERAGDLPDRLLRDYLSGWTSQYTEYDYFVPDDSVYGTIPEDIRGTLFLIGPGLTEVYGTSVRHPSDADGMVCSLAFGDGGQIFFRNRYVRTPSFMMEQTLGRRVSRGLHDRGAPLLTGQQQDHHQEQQQARREQRLAAQRGPLPGPGQQTRGAGALGALPPGSSTPGAGATPGSHASAASAARPGPTSARSGGAGAGGGGGDGGGGWAFGNGFDWLSGVAHGNGSGGGGGTGRPPEVDVWEDVEEVFEGATAGASRAVTALASAASGAVPKQFRLDPLVLMGLPPLPPLSSLFNPLDTSFRAPANASIVFWGGRLLAFTEGGSLPYELNKLSLETVGQYDASGAMADIGRLVGGYKIAPAPQQQSQQQQQGQAGSSPPPASASRLVLMGAAQSGLDTLVRWVELREDGAPAGPPTTYRLPGCTARGLKDFWVTDRFYVVVQAPVDFNPQRFATQATIGAASFAECFDWDPSRPSKIHLVPRPGVPQTTTSTSIAAPTTTTAAISTRSGSPSRTRAIVWPPQPGPAAVVLEGPPVLPTSCVGSYSPSLDGRLLVLDGVCQQGLTGSSGGTLDSIDPWDHRYQPKPELVRISVDLAARTATARVLTQRTISSATTAATFTSGAAASSSASASGSLVPTGHGSSSPGGYHHLYAAGSAIDTASAWAPSQVLLKVVVPPEYGVPAAAAVAVTAARLGPSAASLRRGVGAELWTPGDRIFVGPPVFIPRRRPQATAAGGGAATSASSPLESEVGAAAAAAAAATAAQQRLELETEGLVEQEGWLVVMMHDAATMVAELCILDAADLTRGPVAVVALPHHLPHVHAAHFTRTYVGPGLAAPPGWRPRTATANATTTVTPTTNAATSSTATMPGGGRTSGSR